MAAAVAASPNFAACPNDLAGVCSAHNEAERSKVAAMELQDILSQCISKNVERELQQHGICNNAHQHFADVASMQQCSSQVGFYSTGQIVANLLHLVVQLVAFPKPGCVVDQGAQTEVVESCSQSVQCDVDIPIDRPPCETSATQTDSMHGGGIDEAVQVNTVAAQLKEEQDVRQRSAQGQDIQQISAQDQHVRQRCAQEKDVQTERDTCVQQTQTTKMYTCVQQTQTKVVETCESSVQVFNLLQQTQTAVVESCEATVQAHADTSDSDVQVTLVCQRCKRRSAKNHFCVDCTVPPRRDVLKTDTGVQADELCHCCFECPGKTTFCGVCLKVLKLSPPTEVDLCWECGMRIAFVKGGRCTVCVKTDSRETPPPNFPVRIGGGYDVLRVSSTGESVQAYSEAAQETVRYDHNQFAHGAPGHLTLPERFHVGVVFQPCTSRKDSIEPDRSVIRAKSPRQRPKSAGDFNSKEVTMLGKSPRQRPQSAAGVVSNGAVYRHQSQPSGDDNISEKTMDRMLAKPRPCMWRVLGDNRPLREPPPW